MAKKEIAVKVQDLTKTFHIPLEASTGIKQKLINTLKGRKGYREFTPLNDISFEIEKGDFFGIVGRNGSGKSTLLKSIAGIYTPNGGHVQVSGKLVPFIELGVGFNPELTGRENVYLNGALLGFSHKEMDAMYNDIVDFAELEEFMEERLKNYSSGMQVRLAFSIAIRAKGDILLLDEILAVGDEAFQRKCYAYFAELKKENKTVILVTHSMDAVRQFCNRALMIEKGKIVKVGSPSIVAQHYSDMLIDIPAGIRANSKKSSKDINYFSNDNIHIETKWHIRLKENDIKLTIHVTSLLTIHDATITLEIIRNNGESVFRWVTDEKIKEKVSLIPNKKIKLELELENIFPDGEYQIQIAVKNRDRSKNYIFVPNAVTMKIQNRGILSDSMRWKPSVNFKFMKD